MKLQNLILRGFKGIRKGLGRDEITLDLSGLSGIVALVGRNGAGKSTTLECLQPFRIMPSRKLALKDAVNLRDSAKDLEFEINGRQYRALVTVDSQNGKGDGFLWEGEAPLTTGKVTEFDEQVRKLFGSPELFFNSVFCSQASESLLSLRPAQRKDFFAEFLGLGQLQEFSDRAKKTADFLSAWGSGTVEQAERLKREIARAAELKAEKQSAEARVETLTAEVAAAESNRERLAVELDTVKTAAQLSRAAAEQVAHWTRNRNAFEAEFTKEKAAKRAVVDYWEREIQAKVQQVRTVDEKIKALTKIGSVNIARVIADLESEEKTLSSGLDSALKAADVKGRLSVLEADFNRREENLRQQIAGLGSLKAALEQRPPEAPDALCMKCGLVRMSYNAIQQEKQINADLKNLLAEREKAVAVLKRELPQSVESPEAIQKRLKPLRDQLADARARQAELGQLEALKQARAEDERSVFAFRQKKVEAEEAVSLYDLGAAEKRRDTEDKIREFRGQVIVGIEDEVQRAATALKTAETEVADAKQRLVDITTAIAFLERQLKEIETKKAALHAIELQVERSESERRDWALLSSICGRDRLQALELDAAAPAISQYANLLLGHCFQGQFSLRFLTVDEDGREVFDIVVTDGQDGEEENLNVKSGGEKVVVLHALRLALTLYAKERSGRDFRTLFCDEVDGALYGESRREFLATNREAMKLGGFDTMFLVTHSVEVAEGADHLIRFGEESIELQ